MKYDVFISYSRKDLNVVEKFVKDLKVRIPNLTYWFDLTGIESGEEFDEKIIKAIDNSSYVLYFLSPNSMKSRWTKEEVMYAKNCGKKVIPVLLNGATLEGWFLFHFGRVDCIDLSKKEQVEKMIKNLSAWVDKNTDDDGLINNGEDNAGALEVDEETSESLSSSHESKITKPTELKSKVSQNNKDKYYSLKKWSLVSFIVISLVGLIIGVVNYPDKDDVHVDKDDVHVDKDDVHVDKDDVHVNKDDVYVLEVDGTENGHDYVDLGLCVKWATCNVGAKYPEANGYYFAWGETEPKSTYNWDTYKWCEGSDSTMLKYCTDSDYGNVDNKTQLDLSDDAAHANWGGSWRMPTEEEMIELKKKCTWTWTTHNDFNGYILTSKINGRSIFLPAAGFRSTNLMNAGIHYHYWSSSLRTYRPKSAMSVSFEMRLDYRFYGYSVRPVCP
jgi:hypothetical protein